MEAGVSSISGIIAPGEPPQNLRRGSITELESKHKADYAPVFVPAAAIIVALALLLLYMVVAFIATAIFGSSDSPGGVTALLGTSAKARSRINNGELWCVFDARSMPNNFAYPESGVCDAFVYCCVKLNGTGVHVDRGAPQRRLEELVRAANKTRSQGRALLFHAKAFAIVGRRDGTPTLLKAPGSVGEKQLVTRIVSWVAHAGLSGIIMNYDNDLTGDYYTVVRSLYMHLHQRGLWLLQVFDYNNEADTFSAGAFVKNRIVPVVRMGHAYLQDDIGTLACPAQYESGEQATWSFDVELTEYAVFNKASFGRDCLDRTLVTASFRGYHYNIRAHDRKVKRVGIASYASICAKQREPDALSHMSNTTDCLEVRRGNDWFSILGPNSTRLFKRASKFLGLIAFHAEQDDYAGRCGDRFPLLRAAKAQLRHHSKSWSVTLT
ncbi:hypothetical protein V5799_008912 [Amblyomma americanum]|uniref:Uncharacterized protein n=1 Tax=Amblyomma americanum TaxID=6943 RepID=A0AAQ4FD05_AMBAM